MMHHLMRAVCVMALMTLIACDSPEKSQFVSKCVGSGDTGQRCGCAFDALEREVGDIDGEFVSFAADFAKWGAEPGNAGLDRKQLMQKYELNDDEYRTLAGEVGRSMLTAFNQCQQ